MWDSVVSIIVTAVSVVFTWFDELMVSIPGSWTSIFTIIVIMILSRFLLGPLIGVTFAGGSDRVASGISSLHKARKKAVYEKYKHNWDHGLENR